MNTHHFKLYDQDKDFGIFTCVAPSRESSFVVAIKFARERKLTIQCTEPPRPCLCAKCKLCTTCDVCNIDLLHYLEISD